MNRRLATVFLLAAFAESACKDSEQGVASNAPDPDGAGPGSGGSASEGAGGEGPLVGLPSTENTASPSGGAGNAPEPEPSLPSMPTQGGSSAGPNTTATPEPTNAPTNPGPSSPDACAPESQEVRLRNNVLVILYDVSASMGAEAMETWDRSLKWEPVLAGTLAFLEDPEVVGRQASLVFYPSEAAALSGSVNPSSDAGASVGFGSTPTVGDACTAEEYSAFDLAPTEIPSAAFADAIAAVTPRTDDDWRLGGPLAALLEGAGYAVSNGFDEDPEALRTIVMLGDGQPALCDSASDAIGPVVEAASLLAGVAPFYVIAIADPPTEDPLGDFAAELQQVADASGTDSAYHYVETGDPALTAQAVTDAWHSIERATARCSIALPQPESGQALGLDRINLGWTQGDTTEYFHNDPACADDSGWRFDDAETPTSLELCPQTCEAYGPDIAAGAVTLSIAWGCPILVRAPGDP